MDVGHWVTIAIFAATQMIIAAGTAVGVIIATRMDTGILKQQVRAMQEDLSKFGNVLVTLADFKGEINLINDRLLAQGKRLDEEINRANRWRDRQEDSSG
jgi:hypothetical protein